MIADVTAAVVGRGQDGPVVPEDGRELWGNENDSAVKISPPTPESGTYAYPEDAEKGPPEVFTLWVFDVNDPEPEDWDGAFWGAGNTVVEGPDLTLSGRISTDTEPFKGDPPANPDDAKVQLVVAPHGALNPMRFVQRIAVLPYRVTDRYASRTRPSLSFSCHF